MNNKNIFSIIGIAAVLTGACSLSSCNEESDSEKYVAPVNLAVTDFSLIADLKNPGLDSTYFSIDLEHGVIFNADSLRKGIRIDKVVPKITFSSAVSEAVIVMKGGTTREGEVDYKKNPTDSIDFTGDVTLRVKAADGTIGTSYRIKVNVHKQDPDTLFWDNISRRDLPTRLDHPKAMKTVMIDGKIISLVEERDGTFSTSSPQSAGISDWNVKQISFPFTPDVRTLTVTADATWLLDNGGRLWKGDTGLSGWSDTGETWTALIGAYNESVVGISGANGSARFSQYPLADLNVKEIPSEFPVSGFSNFVTLANQWTSSPVAFFTGGISADGSYSDDTWAFDGAEWIKLCSGGIPALQGASIIPYYNYRRSASGTSMIEYKVWMMVGGRMADGKFNRTVYISYNNGVDWAKGSSSLQLPEIIPAMSECDNLVVDLSKSANLTDGWKSVRRQERIPVHVDGDVVRWECPYIFLFGGYLHDGTLNTTIWRGVLSRLTFTPII